MKELSGRPVVVPAANLVQVSDRDPRIIPGVSASQARSHLGNTMGIFFVLSLLVFIGGCVTGGLLTNAGYQSVGELIAIFAAVFGTPLLGVIVCVILSRIANRAEQAELAAGYTTLVTQFDQVDGIDWKTGLVTRPAKRHAPSTSGAIPFTTGFELGSINSGATGLDVLVSQRIQTLVFVLSTAVAVVSFFIIFTRYLNYPDSGVATLLGWVGSLASVAAILFLTLAITLGPERYYVQFLVRRFSGDRVFGTQTAGDFKDVLGELFAVDAPRLPQSRPRLTCYLVFETEQLVLYSRKGPEVIPFLVVPRTRISSTRMDVNKQSRGPDIPVVVLALQKDDGTSTDLRLQFLPRASFPPSKVIAELRDDNEWVAGWANSAA